MKNQAPPVLPNLAIAPGASTPVATSGALAFSTTVQSVMVWRSGAWALLAPKTGLATLDFGAGTSDVALAVTGQAGIPAGAVVIASLSGATTADHSAEEHALEELDVVAGNVVAGVGFTIYGKTRNVALRGQWRVAWSWS